MLKRAAGLLALLIVLPVLAGAAWSYGHGWPASWRAADWSSAGLAPAATASPDALVQVYAARSGRWKGIFAVHTWIVLKPQGATACDRYEVVGWGNPVRHNAHVVDGRWYGNLPQIVQEVRGPRAARLIAQIERAIARYPYAHRGDYTVWPGPNSNSFIAWIARSVPELQLEMPPTAIGKDYLGPGIHAAVTPSGTGWQISLGGLAGIAAGWREGIELHVLGATIGLDPDDLAIKLPSIGTVGPATIGTALAGTGD